MDEQRGDRRIHAAAQSADDAAVADLVADPRRRLLHERRHRPVAGAAADVEGEVPEDVEPAIGVRDFGVEQQRVEPLRRGGHRRHRRVGARGRDGEARRRRRDEVAMARPDAQLGGDRSRRAARPARSGSSRDRTRDAAPARPRRPAGPSSTACRSRSRAPARRFRARRASQRGAPGSDTLFGPPERMMPTGAPPRDLGRAACRTEGSRSRWTARAAGAQSTA